MEQRLRLETLGVADLGRSRRFYEGFGWKTTAAPDDDVIFFQAGGMILALWSRSILAEDSVVQDGGGGAGTQACSWTRTATRGRSPTTRAGHSGTTGR